MIAKVSQSLTEPSAGHAEVESGPVHSFSALPLLAVLWRRRWTVAITLFFCIGAAVFYLLKATPIYTSSSSIYIEQSGNRILSDAQAYVSRSDTFLNTQAEVLRSSPILAAALDRIGASSMKTFAKIDNPVAWLRLGTAFRVDVGRKNDIVSVSMDSPYPQEAAVIVNGIVESYINQTSQRKKSNAQSMLDILREEQKRRTADVENATQALLKFKQDNGDLSFQDPQHGSIVVQELASLRSSLVDAEVSLVDLATKHDAAKSVLDDPAKIKEYVQGLQSRGSSYNDQDYDTLQSELRRYQVTAAAINGTVGEQARQRQALMGIIQTLQQQMAEKERRIAEASIAQLALDRSAAEQKVLELKARVRSQEEAALGVSKRATDLARLEGDLERFQKQSDQIDSRIKEVAVNSEDPGTLNVQQLGVARAEDKPSKPARFKTMAMATFMGLLLGCGFAMLREWFDQGLASPDEVTATLGLPILSVVPHMRGRHTLVSRGQHVHLDSTSDVSEAYRTARTALFFGAPRDAKLFLVTSPAPGDGKSTTASNLAIALSQAGHRTLLIDCDLRKPVQHKLYELSDSVGVCSVISGTAKLRDAVQKTNVARLYVLPCGPLPPNPSELLTSKRFEQVLKVLESAFDRIVIDSPPVAPVSDAQILSAAVGATVLVVRTRKTTRRLASFAADALRGVGANVVGVIVNDQPRRRAGYGYYGGSYQYGSYGVSRRSAPALEGARESEERGLVATGSSSPLSRDAIDLSHEADESDAR